MKKLFYTLIAVVGLLTTSQAQFAEHVKVLDVKVNNSKVLAGSLSEGRYIDLRFGLRGSVKCFTEVQKKYFNGHHVLYAFEVPANTKVLVELTTKSNMSLYGYMIDKSRYDIPPYLENVSKAGCSSSANPMGELDRIMLKAGSSPTHVVIGVTGIEEADQGAFNLKIVTRE